MKNKLFFILFLFCVFSVKAQQQADLAQFPEAAQVAKSNFTYKVIASVNQTFGYDIYSDEKLMIHQPSIPSMPGNEGFKLKPEAEQIAQLVITKMKKGEMPPSVTIEELKKLNITIKQK